MSASPIRRNLRSESSNRNRLRLRRENAILEDYRISPETAWACVIGSGTAQGAAGTADGPGALSSATNCEWVTAGKAFLSFSMDASPYDNR